MKKLLFISIITVVFSCSKKDTITTIPDIVTTGQLELVDTYGGSKNEIARAIVNTTDGGYAILGSTQSNNGDITDKTGDSYDYYLLKFSSDGMKEWGKTYGGSEDDRGNDIIQTSDGGYAILGYSTSNNEDVTNNAGSQDFWMVKLDASGNLSWQKSFGYSGADYGTTLLETNDNGYLITGVLDVTASGGEGNSRNSQRHAGGDIWALKLSNTGTLEWSKFYGGSFTDTPLGITQDANNNFIIVGSSDSDDVDISGNKGSYDFWVIKISNTGTLIWEKSFGGSEIDEARAITDTGDGNFIIVGDTRSNNTDVSSNHGAADLWMIKISTEGNLLWNKSFGGTSFDVARSIFRTQDGGYLVAGSSRSLDGDVATNKGQNDAWILKTDAAGNLLWETTAGGSEIDFAYDATQLTNGTVIAVGESSSNNGDITEGKGFSDVLIIKIK